MCLLSIRQSVVTSVRESTTQRAHLDNVAVGAALVRLAVFGVLEQNAVHVSAGVLVELACAAEHDERNVAVAQHRQLVRLLHQAELALRERHLRGNETLVSYLFIYLHQAHEAYR